MKSFLGSKKISTLVGMLLRAEFVLKTQKPLFRLMAKSEDFVLRREPELHKSILKHNKFLSGEYTTQFCENDLKVETPDLFKFVDDRVFLISAAISAYKDREKNPVEKKYEDITPWKLSGRDRGLRI